MEKLKRQWDFVRGESLYVAFSESLRLDGR